MRVTKNWFLLSIYCIMVISLILPSQVFAQNIDYSSIDMQQFLDNPEKPIKELEFTENQKLTGIEKRYIIMYKNSISDKDVDDLKKINAKVKTKLDNIRTIIATGDKQKILKFKQNANVADVFEDYPVKAVLDESVIQIKADQVHAFGATGAGKKACVVDTGINKSHPYLNLPIAEVDYVNGDGDATDDNGHGTHVTGIMASTHPIFGGVAPDVSILTAKALDQDGFGSASDIVSAINWCVANGADIINMSLTGGLYISTCNFTAISIASNNAANQGVAVFAATGNDGISFAIGEPACASGVIAVGSVDKNDVLSVFSNGGGSNGGQEIDVVAPGSSILSTYLGIGFASGSGTSMATPHAAATAALLLDGDPSLTPAEIRTTLRNTAMDLGLAGPDTAYGYGRIDAEAAFSSISISNGAPQANAGLDQIVNEQTLVTLDGSGSTDPEGDPLTYSWKQILQVPQDDIARLKFEDNLLDTSTSGGNDGTIFGTTTFVDGNTGLGRAFSFDGASHMTLDNPTDFDFTNTDAFSISLWFKTTDTGYNFLAGKTNSLGNNDNGYAVFTRDGQVRFKIMDGSGNTIQLLRGGTSNDGTWHHFVATYDGSGLESGMRIYLDKVGSGSSSTTPVTSGIQSIEPFSIGAEFDGGSAIAAEIDEVRVYDRVLQINDVQSLFDEAS